MAPQNLEKRKLIPQDKGETPSQSKKEKTQVPVQTPILEQSRDDQPKIPIRMIRGERREIEEEIANRILSDISEEGSIAGSLASLEDFEIPKVMSLKGLGINNKHVREGRNAHNFNGFPIVPAV